MASTSSPFEVEDQTDEDFFDKLVDDDFGPTESSAPKVSEGNDSDDAKAFANLTITDVTPAFEDLSAQPKIEKGVAQDGNLGLLDTAPEPAPGSDSTTIDDCKSSGSAGFKVVDWNSFHADSDSAQNGAHGFGSYSDFFNELDEVSGELPVPATTISASGNEDHRDDSLNGVVKVNYAQHHQESQYFGATVDQNTNGQDPNSTEYWETLYPGWKYDSNTGQWYQVDAVDPTSTASAQATSATNSASDWSAVSDVKSEVSYMQQTSQSVLGTATATETSTSQSVSSWNQVSQANNGYPEHMVFDPQYPGWYYDTIAQEWRSLDTYASTVQDYSQQSQNGFVSSNSSHGGYSQADTYGSRGLGEQGQEGRRAGSYNNDNQNNLNMWQPEVMPPSAAPTTFSGNQQMDNSYGSNSITNNDQQTSFGAVPSYSRSNQGHNEANGTLGFQSFSAVTQSFNQANMKLNDQLQFSNDYYGSQKPVNFTQQSFPSGNQFPYAPSVGRSPDGRPPHALVTFGFGGKLIVMKDHSNIGNSSYGSQVRP